MFDPFGIQARRSLTEARKHIVKLQTRLDNAKVLAEVQENRINQLERLLWESGFTDIDFPNSRR